MDNKAARAKAIALATKYYSSPASQDPYLFQATVDKFYLFITTGRWDR